MTRNFTLFEVIRGIIVAIIASVIINFMILILGPVLPILSFDGFIPILIFLITIILTLVTYFLLPTEKVAIKDNLDLIPSKNTEI